MYTIRQLLSALVICEAWRRYFVYSPKVHAVFGKPSSKKIQEAAHNAPPAEIGIFMLLCWLLIFDAIPRLNSSYGRLSAAESYIPFWLGLRNLVLSIASVILPVFALDALKQRNGLRPLLWCLGVWLALAFSGYAVYDIMHGVYKQSYDGSAISPLDTYFTKYTIFPLVYWWYFTTSQKARTWCGETPAEEVCLP